MNNKILLNDSIEVDGKFSFTAEYDESTKVLDISGGLVVTGPYIDYNVESIANERYELTGVRIYRESFGSEDDEIVYYFRAQAYSINEDTETDENK